MNVIQKTVSVPSRGLKTRLHIKTFKYSDDMHKFLNKQHDNKWVISNKDLKTGVYAYAGGVYHNVKHLDASVLAHI